LPPADQAAAGVAVVPAVLNILGHESNGVVAGYLARKGELDPEPTLAALAKLGWQTVLPVCGADQSLTFCPWSPGERLAKRDFGLREPISDPVESALIDAVLVPGVGFDPNGARIGHGAGFYDRFFAAQADTGHEPVRIGLAHDLQVITLPTPETWDVAMHHLVTPTRVFDV